MKYAIKLGDRTLRCDVEELEHGRLSFDIEGRKYRVGCLPVSGNRLSLEIDGRTVAAFVARSGRDTHIVVRGRSFTAAEEDESGAGAEPGAAEVMNEVTPPMPAEVVRILVKEGERVEKGQGLVVVSAMKMEITLKSPRAGVAGRIRTREGAKVMPGDELVEIEDIRSLDV